MENLRSGNFGKDLLVNSEQLSQKFTLKSEFTLKARH